MKRADLTVGQDVLVSEEQRWVRWGLVDRVRVVDVGNWHKWRHARPYSRRDEDSTVEIDGVTFEIDNALRSDAGFRAYKVNAFIGREVKTEGLGPPRAYLMIHAKGPWDEANAARQKVQKAERESKARQDRDRAEAEAERVELERRLSALGISLPYWGGSDRRTVSVRFEHLRALIELAERGK